MVHMENTSRIPWRGIVRFTVLCTVYSDPDNNTGIQVLGEWSREWIMLISYIQDSFCMPGNIYIRWPGFFWQ